MEIHRIKGSDPVVHCEICGKMLTEQKNKDAKLCVTHLAIKLLEEAGGMMDQIRKEAGK